MSTSQIDKFNARYHSKRDKYKAIVEESEATKIIKNPELGLPKAKVMIDELHKSPEALSVFTSEGMFYFSRLLSEGIDKNINAQLSEEKLTLAIEKAIGNVIHNKITSLISGLIGGFTRSIVDEQIENAVSKLNSNLGNIMTMGNRHATEEAYKKGITSEEYLEVMRSRKAKLHPSSQQGVSVYTDIPDTTLEEVAATEATVPDTKKRSKRGVNKQEGRAILEACFEALTTLYKGNPIRLRDIVTYVKSKGYTMGNPTNYTDRMAKVYPGVAKIGKGLFIYRLGK